MQRVDKRSSRTSGGSWYKAVLIRTSRKEITVVGLVLAILIVMSVTRLFLGESFVWKDIAPISTPDLWNRIFWSALTFATLGAILYHLRFYLALSWLFGSDRGGYRQAKGLIWMVLILFNYHIFPVVVDIMNTIISVAYNSLVFAVYSAPVLLAGLVLGVLFGLLTERKQISELIRTKDPVGLGD